MSVLPILRWPDPALSQVCAPAVGDLTTLAADMLDTMYAAPGRGLAAPQVGVLTRLFVMDETWKDGDPNPMVFVNPEIVETSEHRTTQPEGCLSIPGILTDITRPAEVTLRWTDLNGTAQADNFTGFAAACVQHEIDHLNGIVTLDHLDAETREQLLSEVSQ